MAKLISTCPLYLVVPLLLSLLAWNPGSASAAVSTCVVKLQFSGGDKADIATDTFAKKILDEEGYKVIDDWLFTIWSHRDYDGKITITLHRNSELRFPVKVSMKRSRSSPTVQETSS